MDSVPAPLTPSILTLPDMPTPPATVNAPDILLVLGYVLAICMLPVVDTNILPAWMMLACMILNVPLALALPIVPALTAPATTVLNCPVDPVLPIVTALTVPASRLLSKPY